MKFHIRIFFIVLLPFFLSGCSYLFGRSAVKTNPQYARATETGKVIIDQIIVDDEIWAENYVFNIDHFGLPKSDLQGVSAIGTSFTSEDDEVTRKLSFALHLPDNSEEGYYAEGLLVVIDDVATEHPADRIYRSQLWLECPEGNGVPWEEDEVIVPVIPREDVVLEQTRKHIILRGTFDIPPTEIPSDPFVTCTFEDRTIRRNTEQPATIELRGIHYEIDTEIIFKWCDKGGKCYEI